MTPKVALIIESSRAYGRGLLSGIAKYSSLHGPWMFYRQSQFYLNPELLTQLSQIGIKIGGFDSASGVSFHHKTFYLAGDCISSAAAVSANSS